MATSGWQNEQLIVSRTFSASLALYGNIYISAITHSGTNLRVQGTIALCPRQNGTYGTCTYGYAQYVTPEGGSQTKIVDANTRMVTPGHPTYTHTDYYANFDVTLTGVAASTTSRNFTVNFYNASPSYGYNVNLTWGLTFDASGTAPSGLDVSINTIKDTEVSFDVSLSSYGSPDSASGRYIEAALLDTSTYGQPYRYNTASNTSSATITVAQDTAAGAGGLNIIGNRLYYYGAYSNNTVLYTYLVKGSLITLPAFITDVVVNDSGNNDMVISVLHDREGTSDTVYTEYSYNQTNWTTVSETFHLTVNTATTVYIRRTNSTGSTPVHTVSIVPATTIKLYGSVNNQSKEIKKLYGSVGGQSKRIRKLYGSVNGRSKLIYEDNS